MDFEARKKLEPKPQNKKPLVLIVDNDYDNLLLASCIVESIGMSYVVADDSKKCLQLIEELLPEIVLLDIVMPEINGLEITRIVKQMPKLSAIPIIAITGLTRPEDIKKILEAGCDDYLTKPYLIEELEAKIVKFIAF